MPSWVYLATCHELLQLLYPSCDSTYGFNKLGPCQCLMYCSRALIIQMRKAPGCNTISIQVFSLLSGFTFLQRCRLSPTPAALNSLGLLVSRRLDSPVMDCKLFGAEDIFVFCLSRV